MRLLTSDDCGALTLTDFPNEIDPPPYAILSHTWGEEEVVFEDIQNGCYKSKLGHRKIEFCAEQAQTDGLKYFWVDTCCINKAHHTELSESIVSMGKWYQRATKCYVYLVDVSFSSKRVYDSDTQLWRSSFRHSRWFHRGWTLQELLLPTSVDFFSKERQLLGSRTTLVSLLSEITTIPASAFQGTPLKDFPIHERMRWAATRDTTKVEDRAYCLLGIFQVYMLPIYGEGENAVTRLMEEINKSNLSQLYKFGHSFLKSASSAPSVVALDAASPVAAPTGPLQDRRAALLESLSFEQMDDRREAIRSASSKTCSWLTSHPTYMDWIDPGKYELHHGLLWIKAKPGAGKSTLMKYILGQACKSPRNQEILLSYFFNARGDMLERSTSGMYRSLLHQLLQKEDLRHIFEEISLSDSWTIVQLRELFTSAIRELRGQYVKCYIDALDECIEQEVRDMIAHFNGLGQVSDGRFCICFASRYYPTIVVPDGYGVQILLEDESGHREDLTKYIRKHLRVGSGKARADLEAKVQLKANSVFMWAVLVTDILNDEYRRGSIFNVEKRLNEIPAELSDLFEDILLRDGTRREHLLLCIQWVLFAKKALRLEEFYFAMAAGLVEGSVAEWDSELVSIKDMIRYVSDCSKGLAELIKSNRTLKVQFIHESVRDFLLKDGGLFKLWPELEADPEGLSHNQLSKCCQRSLKVESSQCILSSSLQQTEPVQKAKQRPGFILSQRFPFLQYALEHVFHHANQATKSLATGDFLSEFDLKQWTHLWNKIPHRRNHHFTENTPLLYILADQDSAWLIRQLCQLDSTISPTPDEYYRHPLLAAIANRSWDATRAILEQYRPQNIEGIMSALELQPDLSVGRDVSPLHWACRRGCTPLAEMLVEFSSTDLNSAGHHGRTPLSLAAQYGHEAIVEHLLSKQAADQQARSALYCAAQKGHNGVVKLLLDADPDLNVREYSFHRLVITALENAHRNTVKLLLTEGLDANTKGDPLSGNHRAISVYDDQILAKRLLDIGIDINVQRYRGGNALQAASLRGHLDTAKLLLDVGADVNAQGGHYGNALQAALISGHLDTVKLLLDAGADVNAQEGHCGSTLHAASISGHLDIVKLLLDAGADVNAQGGHYGNALQAASSYGHRKIVKLLLDAGADVNAQGGHYGNALQAALRQGHTKVAKLLLDNGAHPDAWSDDELGELGFRDLRD